MYKIFIILFCCTMLQCKKEKPGFKSCDCGCPTMSTNWWKFTGETRTIDEADPTHYSAMDCQSNPFLECKQGTQKLCMVQCPAKYPEGNIPDLSQIKNRRFTDQ